MNAKIDSRDGDSGMINQISDVFKSRRSHFSRSENGSRQTSEASLPWSHTPPFTSSGAPSAHHSSQKAGPKTAATRFVAGASRRLHEGSTIPRRSSRSVYSSDYKIDRHSEVKTSFVVTINVESTRPHSDEVQPIGVTRSDAGRVRSEALPRSCPRSGTGFSRT